MLSLRAGNWFLSPKYVLGSQDQDSDYLYICFHRHLYDDLEVKVMGYGQKILFSQSLDVNTKDLKFFIKDWPKGEYELYLQDKERSFIYKIRLQTTRPT